MKILYLGWIGQKNVGDELMFNIFTKYIREKKGPDYTVKGLLPPENYDKFNDYDLICLGGGSILLPGYIDILYRAAESGKEVMIWGSAYDSILDKKYIDRIENSDKPIYLYSDLTEFQLNEIAKKAIFFGVRGPLTYKILEKSHIDMNNIIVSGDPGFLLEGSKNLVNSGTEINFKKEDKVVGINFGTTYNKLYGQNENYVSDALSNVCKKLLKDGYKIYLFALWNNDLDALLNLYKKLPHSDNIILDLLVHNAEDIVSIVKNCEFTINFKLHANVISAVANVPFISLGYRAKAHDFLESIDLDDLNIFTNEENLEDEIMKKIAFINTNSTAIKNTLKRKIYRYKQILRKVFINL